MKPLVIFAMLYSVSSPASPMDPVGFLRGCWGMTNHSGMRVTEDWFKGSQDTMLGISQELSSENQTINHEFLRISWSPETKILTYHPTLNDQPSSFFIYDSKLSEAGVRAVFANPYHDFPKTIAYEVKKETLTIALYGEDEAGHHQELSYELKKEDCLTRY